MPTVQTDDVTTYYEHRGSGVPVVFVHGGWADHEMWRPQLDALADSYHVVAYDLRGHGRTGPSSRRRYSVDLFADDLHRLAERLSLDRPFVVGLSLGGMVAQAYAASYPDDLRGLVLADTAASTRLTQRDRFAKLLAPAWSISATAHLLGVRRYSDLAFTAADWFRGPDWVGRDPAVRSYLREAMAAFDAAEFEKVLRAIYQFDGVDTDAISVPTLVLRGEFEDASMVEHAAYLERTIADARGAVVPDAGHTANMENPEAFTRELEAFFETVHP